VSPPGQKENLLAEPGWRYTAEFEYRTEGNLKKCGYFWIGAGDTHLAPTAVQDKDFHRGPVDAKGLQQGDFAFVELAPSTEWRTTNSWMIFEGATGPLQLNIYPDASGQGSDRSLHIRSLTIRRERE
jgi:hypothetical protein